MRKQTKIWTTKTGEKIRICDMTDSHLANTIKFLERQAVDYVGSLYGHGFSDGSMAELAFERGISLMEEEGVNACTVSELGENLYDEIGRRKTNDKTDKNMDNKDR